MRKTIFRVISISAICTGVLYADGIGDNIIHNARTSATNAVSSAVSSRVNSLTNSMGLGNIMGGNGFNINTNDIFGYSSSNVLSGSVGGLQYGCSIDNASFGTGGLGNFSFGKLFKSIDFGFFKCDIGIDLDKATCKNVWFDESKQKLYGAVDGARDEVGEWGKKGKDWLYDNVLDYKQDKSGIWGYGAKAKETADKFCGVVDDHIWGNGGGTNGGKSVVDRRAENIKINGSEAILFDYIYGNSEQETVKLLKNSDCFNENSKIKSIKEEIANADYNPQSLKDEYRNTVKTIGRQCIAEASNNNNAINVANKVIASLSSTNPNANGTGTDATYSKIKNQSMVINTTAQAQANSQCADKTTSADKQACIEAKEADFRMKSLDPSEVNSSDGISGERAKIYKNEQEAFENNQRVKMDLLATAYSDDYGELESLDGDKNVLLTDEEKAKRLNEVNRNNAIKTLNSIRQNELFSIQEQQARLHIDSAIVASEVFNKQAAINETNAVVSKSQEMAQQVVNAILGSN